ncbi:MAG: hypothetical protein ACREMF_12015, partial [Gemmatimonadales bacterium]
MFPLPPLVATALVAVAALLATRLARPPWLSGALGWAATASPLGWYLVGTLLGPALELLDHPLLEASIPVLACAIGWVACRAAAGLASPIDTRTVRASGIVADVVAFLAPAGLLVAALRLLPPALVPVWKPVWPTVATLAAALAVAGAASLRHATIGALIVASGAVFALLPLATSAGLRETAQWMGFTLGGAVLCTLFAERLARGSDTPMPGMIAAICLGAGIGLASGASPFVVCALTGLALARWSPAHARLARELATSEPAVAAVLWVAAGALVSGPFPGV